MLHNVNMKLTKKEIALLVAAIFIPGGGIAAGVYFLNKLRKKEEKDVQESEGHPTRVHPDDR